MKCPSCHSEMKKGWIPLTRGLTWKELDEKSSICFPKGNIPGLEVGWRLKRMYLYRCDACEIMSFYFGEKTEESNEKRV
ncbi:MAG: PF20097 family protein [Lentisphaeria bacterium]|nr:PF20097 family protein [Lentisphaeria bacterium]